WFVDTARLTGSRPNRVDRRACNSKGVCGTTRLFTTKGEIQLHRSAGHLELRGRDAELPVTSGYGDNLAAHLGRPDEKIVGAVGYRARFDAELGDSDRGTLHGPGAGGDSAAHRHLRLQRGRHPHAGER